MVNQENVALQCPFSKGKLKFRAPVSEENSSKKYVKNGSIVREIWGKSDVILFIFAGSAAEFALHKSVDWLYFTGKLPNDPLGRMFSTVDYARKIVFASEEEAHKTIETIAKIHNAIEKKRGYKIPDWAYRDVLSMLMYYSISAFELLERKLKPEEKEAVYHVFSDVGKRMGIQKLPENFQDWWQQRQIDLRNNYKKSDFTIDLFLQYRKHLGNLRYHVLLEAQKLVCPKLVKQMLNFKSYSVLSPTVPIYKICKTLKLDWMIKEVLLPSEYKKQIADLDIHSK